jgi:membrane-associated protein
MLGPDWLEPERLIESFGSWALLGVCVIVFVESGLLVGFFLPGDSLLFTAGLLTATGFISLPLWLVCITIFLAAFIGDQVGYMIGRTAGPAVFKRPDSRLFKQEHVDRTHAFFERYGGRAVILARFVPIVRTFVPVAAGVGRMSYRHFVSYNVIGAFLWGVGVTVLGYFLGQVEWVHQNIELVLVLIVALSVTPIAIEVLRHKLSARREARANLERV